VTTGEVDVEELLAREAVRAMIAEYNGATDRGDLDGIAACFTADGTLQIGRAEPIPRARIAQVLTETLATGPTGRPRPAFVHHHVSSTRLTPISATEIRADSYFAVFTQIGPDHWGRYRDVHALEAGRWRIRTRRIVTDGSSPDSLLVAAPKR
jgi:hypothetical protein